MAADKKLGDTFAKPSVARRASARETAGATHKPKRPMC